MSEVKIFKAIMHKITTASVKVPTWFALVLLAMLKDKVEVLKN